MNYKCYLKWRAEYGNDNISQGNVQYKKVGGRSHFLIHANNPHDQDVAQHGKECNRIVNDRKQIIQIDRNGINHDVELQILKT